MIFKKINRYKNGLFVPDLKVKDHNKTSSTARRAISAVEAGRTDLQAA
jgi:hypothetical protein